MRRVILLTLALSLLAGAASAAFSPAGRMDGNAELRASVRLDALSPLGESSLHAVNAWLDDAQIVVTARESGGDARSRMLLTVGGAALIDVVSLYRNDYALTAFSREDDTYRAYLTAGGRRDALSLLTGDDSASVSPSALIKAFVDGSGAMYALLEGVVTPRTVKSSTSIKNVGTSSQYVEYKLTDEQMNGVWQSLLDAALPFFDAALLSAPAVAPQARAFLSALTFSGECRFKRMQNKAGEDIGLQFTARAASGEDARKVTVFGGYKEGAGLYMSFALPAVKGKNNMKLTVSVKLTEKKTTNTLAAEVAYTNALNGVTEEASLSATLKNNLTNGENITGKITLTAKRDGVKTAWTIEPSLAAATGDDRWTGTAAFQRKTGGALDLKGTLTLSCGAAAGDDDITEKINGTLDLTGMTDEAAATALAGEKAIFLSRFVRLIAALPEAERTLLTHELRTDAWMTAPSVSTDAAPDPYRVTEEE